MLVASLLGACGQGVPRRAGDGSPALDSVDRDAGQDDPNEGDAMPAVWDAEDAPVDGPNPTELVLSDGWKIRSSRELVESGEAIARPGFVDSPWFSARTPSTVFGALVANGVYPDPTYGKNLLAAPGMDYPVGGVFSWWDVASTSPYADPWWYRTQFVVPSAWQGRQIWLRFDGINYSADLFVNGTRLDSSDRMRGSFRHFEYNVTDLLRPGQANAVALRVAIPESQDLALTFVDWNPMPPDKMMGLWNDVRVLASGPVSLRDVFVQSQIEQQTLAKAALTVRARLTNASKVPVAGVLSGSIGKLTFAQSVSLSAAETREVTFSADQFPQLLVNDPQLWWPWQYGTPTLYDLDLVFDINGTTSDAVHQRFGIREISSRLTPEGHRLFTVNGKPILIRGAGYTPDFLYRRDASRDEAEMRYVRAMNLNTIRLEGKLGNEHLMDLCDELGILVMAGWCCCDSWEKWEQWTDDQRQVSTASLRDQIRPLRAHPSLLVWMNGSDNPPPAQVEKAYLAVLDDAHWPLAQTLSSASATSAEFSGPSGVKMRGPYDWVPPKYWLTRPEVGGASGFATEVGPGPAIPPLESLRRFLPPEQLWPINDTWTYHAGGGVFASLDHFVIALNQRHGVTDDLDGFTWKAQLMAYEGVRAMFEAFAGKKYQATGVIHWMLNNAWPSLIWHLYDYFLKPGGGFFGAQKACEVLHAQFHYDDRSIVVVNSGLTAQTGLRVLSEAYGKDGVRVFSRAALVDVAADGVTTAFVFPEIPEASNTTLLRLVLANGDRTISQNVYWLSSTEDVLEDENDWYTTPTRSYADMTGLNELPPVALKVDAQFDPAQGHATIHLQNPGDTPAFFVRVEILDGPAGSEILPVIYSDNYISVFAGETATIEASFAPQDAAHLRVRGHNVRQIEWPIQ